MKFKIFTDKLIFVFTPITYVHLMNISKCVQVQGSQSKESKQGIIQERYRLFKNAKSMDMIKMNSSANLTWKPYLALISGSYIYFLKIEDKYKVRIIIKVIKKQNLKNKTVQECTVHLRRSPIHREENVLEFVEAQEHLQCPQRPKLSRILFAEIMQQNIVG